MMGFLIADVSSYPISLRLTTPDLRIVGLRLPFHDAPPMSRLPEIKKTKVNANNKLYPTLLDQSEGFTQACSRAACDGDRADSGAKTMINRRFSVLCLLLAAATSVSSQQVEWKDPSPRGEVHHG